MRRLPAHALRTAAHIAAQLASREDWRYPYRPNVPGMGPMTIDDQIDQLEDEWSDRDADDRGGANRGT